MSCDQSRGSQLRMCRSSAHGVCSVDRAATPPRQTVHEREVRIGYLRASRPLTSAASIPSFDPHPAPAHFRSPPDGAADPWVTPPPPTTVPTPARLMVCPRPSSVNGNLDPGQAPRKRPGPGRMVTQREVYGPVPCMFTFRAPNFACPMSQRVSVDESRSPDRASGHFRDRAIRRGTNPTWRVSHVDQLALRPFRTPRSTGRRGGRRAAGSNCAPLPSSPIHPCATVLRW